MQTRRKAARLALVAGLAVATTACGQYNMLRARKYFKDANSLYQAQEYRRAVTAYEEALRADPDLTAAYFYLANSYDNLYRPSRQGEAENDAFLQKAVENYKLAAERSEDPNLKRLSLQYLVAAYGPDKLSDPSQAEPIVLKMIELEPQEATNYFVLAKIYEDAGNYDEAEATLLKAREAKPNDPAVYTTLAAYYNRQGDFDRTIEALEQRAAREPNNPEAFHMIATFYWEKAFRDFRLTEAQKRDFVMKGLASVDKALGLKPDYQEAMVYKNILLRMQANTEKDPAKQKELIAEADKLRDEAQELRKKRAAGVGD